MMGMKMSVFFCATLSTTGSVLKCSSFFQPEEGGKQQQQYNSQYLEKIIEILQSSPLLAYRQVGVNGVFKSNAPPWKYPVLAFQQGNWDGVWPWKYIWTLLKYDREWVNKTESVLKCRALFLKSIPLDAWCLVFLVTSCDIYLKFSFIFSPQMISCLRSLDYWNTVE